MVQNGEIFQNTKVSVNIFNNYFVNIAGKIDSEIPRTRKLPLDCLGDKLEKSFFYFSYKFCWSWKYNSSIEK